MHQTPLRGAAGGRVIGCSFAGLDTAFGAGVSANALSGCTRVGAASAALPSERFPNIISYFFFLNFEKIELDDDLLPDFIGADAPAPKRNR